MMTIGVWWVLLQSVLMIVVGISEYRLGRKMGRRIGYAEGHRHGVEDTLRKLGVPLKYPETETVVVDVSRFLEKELSLARSKGKPS